MFYHLLVFNRSFALLTWCSTRAKYIILLGFNYLWRVSYEIVALSPSRRGHSIFWARAVCWTSFSSFLLGYRITAPVHWLYIMYIPSKVSISRIAMYCEQSLTAWSFLYNYRSALATIYDLSMCVHSHAYHVRTMPCLDVNRESLMKSELLIAALKPVRASSYSKHGMCVMCHTHDHRLRVQLALTQQCQSLFH